MKKPARSAGDKAKKRRIAYTHRTPDGVRWRFSGARPVSEIADKVMRDCGMPLHP